MIIAALNSGFANQMFQFACARAVSLKKGYEFGMEGTWLDRDPLRSLELPRHFGLERFLLSEKALGTQIRARIGFFGRRLNRYRYPDAFGLQLYQEPHFTFDKNVFNVSDDTLLRGYWQTEKYFNEFADVIRQDFQFASTPSGRNADLIAELAETHSIALHVRRGDYVADPLVAKNHGVCPPVYYERALDLLNRKIDAYRLFVFSDDPDWVRANMQFDSSATYVSWNRGADSFEDMRLMSHCSHNVIANSSFSWWAAWLNANPQKLVVAPQRWFGSLAHDTSDLVPPQWIRL